MPEYDVNYKFETIWHGKIEADSFEDAKKELLHMDFEHSAFFEELAPQLREIKIGEIMQDGSLWYESKETNTN